MNFKLLCVSLVGVLSSAAAFAATKDYTQNDILQHALWHVVDADGFVNCREQPNGRIVAKLPRGTSYFGIPNALYDANGKPWFRLAFDGAGCFVRANSQHIEPDSPTPKYYDMSVPPRIQDRTGKMHTFLFFQVIDKTGLNCRDVPRTGKVVATLKPGATFSAEIISDYNANAAGDVWAQINLGRKNNGPGFCWIQFRTDRVRAEPF